MRIGYCTNVHPGHDLDTTRKQLERVTCETRQRWSRGGELPIGLWLSKSSADELTQPAALTEFRDWLADRRLSIGSLNGFPYGDFHQSRVKYAVYQPDWTSPLRRDYTAQLVRILCSLLPEGSEGSISTLPVTWGNPKPTERQLITAASHLRQIAQILQTAHHDTGRHVTLCLEPEPGCFLQTSRDLVSFFESHLLRGPEESTTRSYLGACHDLCHAAVMFEGAVPAWQNYLAAGISVPKIQVSSAIRVAFDEVGPEQRPELLRSLSAFAEARYLHQTVIQYHGRQTFFDDLPDALRQAASCHGEWRVHYHVPIYAACLGPLGTTQADVLHWLTTQGRALDPPGCFLEVETYAWDVLPPDLRADSLAAGIAQELSWLEACLALGEPA